MIKEKTKRTLKEEKIVATDVEEEIIKDKETKEEITEEREDKERGMMTPQSK